MGFGRTAPGPREDAASKFKSLNDYLDQVREIVRQEIVDIMLLSASNVEKLAIQEGLFKQSKITPAGRANDTSDIWIVRGGTYVNEPSRPFSCATIDHIKYGKLTDDYSQPATGADLALYSMTFANEIERDHATLERFSAFRLECEKKQFRYFLEVFNPNLPKAVSPEEVGSFLNDHIIRALAGGPGRAASLPEDSLQRPRRARGTGQLRSTPDRRHSRRFRRHGDGCVSSPRRGEEIWRPRRTLRPQDQPRRKSAGHGRAATQSRRWRRRAERGCAALP